MERSKEQLSKSVYEYTYEEGAKLACDEGEYALCKRQLKIDLDSNIMETLAPTLTPMMQQYMTFRSQLPARTLLFFRLGDFFELFMEDAVIGGQILGLTVTKRGDTPMAGLPFHAVEPYIEKCLHAGYRVAICDQIEAPQAGKLVARAITQILTPGTHIEASGVEKKEVRLLVALNFIRHKGKIHLGASWADVASGELTLAQSEDPSVLLNILQALPVSEVLLPENIREEWHHDYPDLLAPLEIWLKGLARAEVPRSRFDPIEATRCLQETFKVLTFNGFGIEDDHLGIGPAGALIYYTAQNLCQKVSHFSRMRALKPQGILAIDAQTLRGLEVFRTNSGKKEGSLLWAMDATITAPGARLLEQYLATPLLNLEEIRKRQQSVGAFVKSYRAAENLQLNLRQVRDVPRILSRLVHRRQHPRELGGIRDTLQALPAITQSLDVVEAAYPNTVVHLRQSITDFSFLRELLEKSLASELPQSLGDGPVIRKGYDANLDELRHTAEVNESWLADFERQEQQSTGIKSLKVKYHGTLGYCIEVTKANLSLVPAHYIRRQTSVNSERYTTDVLREQEKRVLKAKEAALSYEEKLFSQLIQNVLECKTDLYETAETIATIDVLVGWSILARRWNYSCPTVDHSSLLKIENGCHPTIEQLLQEERQGLAGTHAFTPNDLSLSNEDGQIAILTGPNMAGKSTYIRQAALMILMAQAGSWVSASHCHIGVVDRLFARIGSGDDLSRGQSTFMVEMAETAHILNTCTPKSFVVIDEVGRGTSTYDGLSLAWAIVEHLNEKEIRTLFATHYQELTQLEHSHAGIKNLSMLVQESNRQIHFLHKVVAGAASRSYGIHVAELAGLPSSVTERANEILKGLETDALALREWSKQNAIRKPQDKSPRLTLPNQGQLCFFEEV